MQKGRDKLRLCQDGGEGVELVQVVTMVGAGVSAAVVKSRMVVLVVRPAKREAVAMREGSRQEEE